jgi:putative PIN family toxin of toxin-antitoxin system
MPLRAVVDAQVFVRYLLARRRGASHGIYVAALAERFELVSSEPLLAEVRRVLRRPKLMRKHGRSFAEVEAFVAELRRGARLVAISGDLKLCRDPKDDAVIETAIMGAAIFVVSDDEDLHALEVTGHLLTHGCRVVKVSDFLRELYPPEPDTTETESPAV